MGRNAASARAAVDTPTPPTYTFYGSFSVARRSIAKCRRGRAFFARDSVLEKLLRHAAAYTDPALESRPLTGFNTRCGHVTV
ncbi:unnamed protein product, partial [Iphiclides podalirius]